MSASACSAQVSTETLKVPVVETDIEENIPSDIDLSKIPNFPFPSRVKNTGSLRGIKQDVTALKLDERLRIEIDSFVNLKTSMTGDYFNAHVIEDLYIPGEPKELLVPKGSWLRGRISYVKKPNILVKIGKIKLHLDFLTTPLGEVTPLSLELDVQQGISNNEGILNPAAINQTKDMNELALDFAKVNNLIQASSLGDLLGQLFDGSLITLFSESDPNNISRGQELQIVLKKDVQLN